MLRFPVLPVMGFACMASSAAVFDVREFGAQGNGSAKDTAAIQRAIDAASGDACGEVHFAPGTYLSGTLFLKSGVSLVLEHGAVLLASPDRADWNAPDIAPQNWTSAAESASGAHLIVAVGQTNVAVRGEGRIDGNCMAFLVDSDGRPWPGGQGGIPWRPSQMLWFAECDGVTVEGVTLVDAPYWTCHFHGCTRVRAQSLCIRTRREPIHTHNGDGLDIDCCEDVLVQDCDIDTADDAIAIRADVDRLLSPRPCARVCVERCRLSSACDAVRLGVGDGDIHDIEFRDIEIWDTRTAVDIVSSWRPGSRGASIERVSFDSVSVDSVVFCRILPNFTREPRIRDIRFSTVTGNVLGPSYVTGRPESPIGRVEFANTDIPCGVYAFHADVRVGGGFPELLPVSTEKADEWNRAISERGEYPFSLAIRGTRRGDSRYGGATRQPEDGVRASCRNGAEILAAVRSRAFAVRLQFGTGLRLADGLSLDEALDLLPDGGIWIELDCAEGERDEARRILRRRGRSHQAVVLAPDAPIAEELAAIAPWMTRPDTPQTREATECPLEPQPEGIPFFLLAGQSNMAGRGLVAPESSDKPIDDCVKLNRAGRWVPATVPLHFDRPFAGVGPGDEFLRRWGADHPGEVAGVVPCAIGGSSIATWTPDTIGDGPSGSNFRAAVRRGLLAKKGGGRLAAILWHQGEADAPLVRQFGGEWYVRRLVTVAEALRRELGAPEAPFLIGDIGTLPGGQGAVINPLLAEAVSRIPNAALVPAADLTGHLPDGIHFDAASQRELGARYYEAYERFRAAPSASLLPESTPRARPGTTVREDAAGWLEVTCDGTYGWPGVELRPKDGGTWDLSRAGVVEVVVSNLGENVELISAEAFPKNRNSGGKIPARCASVPPGTSRLISVQIADARVVTDVPVELDGTNGKIGSAADLPDFSETPQINVFQVQQGNLHPLHFAVLDVRMRFEAVKPVVVAATNFFPFCDRYGQFRHTEWPGKVHSDAELLAARDAEETWLAAHADSPIPDADQYGGWAGGPQLEATGFFRTEKVDGKWWLVDPEGHLFFSLGVTAVYAWTQTRVNGRENYFEWIPGTLAKSWRNDDKLADFLAENLTRKYGADWKPHFAYTTQRRFRAWGINTIGNWSHEYIWALRRTPYVVTIDPSSKNRMAIREKKGIGAAVPDVYSPQFAEDVRAQLQKLAEKVKDDPWCIGIFIDNELDWASPENIPEAAEKYFSTIAAEVKAAMPNHLYLGCRLVRFQPDAWRAAARHCDVVSFNFYERHPTWDLPPDAVDKPIIVGEFHFGALDRGHLAGGCAVAFDQNERAQCFRDFVNACLDNPRYVGCHWFQYTDQAMTGRYFDGEAYQCGFVTVTDTPYPELVEACRETAAQMYGRRMAK